MAQHTRTDTTPRATFVYPDSSPAELAPLPPAQAIQILPPAQAIQIEDVLEGRIRAIERTSPLLSAEAFLLKYAGMTFILAILSAGLVWYAALPAPVFLLLFGGMSIAGYFALGWLEAGHTSFGVERLRLREGAKVLRHKIDADAEVQLAQIDLQAQILEAQREYNRQQDERLQARIQAQLVRHETPQSTANMVANYVPDDYSVTAVSPVTDTGYTVAKPAHVAYRHELEVPSFLREKTQRRVRDEARRTLTDFVASLYERDESGSWLRLFEDGRIRRNVKTPMSARSGLAAPVREQIDAILRELDACGIWLLRYDEDQRLYRLNLDRYPAPDMAVDAIGDVPTQRLM